MSRSGGHTSDSSLLCIPDVRLSPSPAGLPLARAVGSEVSRFSCMQFHGVPGVSDYVGPPSGSRFNAENSVLPSPSDTACPTNGPGFAWYTGGAPQKDVVEGALVIMWRRVWYR